MEATRSDFEFSVVVPTLDEASLIDETLAHLRGFPDCFEIVIADGGSCDGTVERARRAGARLVAAPRGRGPQLNAGARAARGDVLVFLHADCRLPTGAFEAMRDVLRRGHDAGIFPVRFPSRHPILALVSRLSGFESRFTSFGEGALFVRRPRFEALGGFPDWPLMEDVELLARLRRARCLAKARGQVLASPRRYRRHGVFRQQLRNVALFALFHLGVSPHRLASRYDAAPRASLRQLTATRSQSLRR